MSLLGRLFNKLVAKQIIFLAIGFIHGFYNKKNMALTVPTLIIYIYIYCTKLFMHGTVYKHIFNK